ncbi:MAG: DMT family transporter [Alphaproteobacteria bacterium]
MNAPAAAKPEYRGLIRSANLRGALWILLAAMISTGMIYFVRRAAETLPTTEIAFMRGVFGVIIILPFIARVGMAGFKSKQIHLQIARGLNASLILSLGFFTIANMPLAQLTSISFSRPLFVLILAALFLGERLKWFRSIATLIGFAGILIIVRPGMDMDPVALLAVLTAALIALNIVFVKKLTRTDRTETLIFYSTFLQALVLGAVLLLAPLLLSALDLPTPAGLVWITPSWEATAYLLGVSVCGTCMQFCSVRAYRIAEASGVAPFDYSRLLFSAALGYFVFAEVPDGWTWVGAAVVIASTLYIVRREAQIARDDPV